MSTSSPLPLRPTTINAILAEVRDVQARGGDVISLMRGEPDFSTPSHIVEAGAAAIREGRTRYPDNQGEPALREAVARKLRRENGLEFDAGTEILVTTGATLGIQTALLATLSPGDEVLLPDPVYDAYASPIALAGGRVRSVPARLEGGRFVLDPGELDAAAGPSTRVVLLNTPWNPTGTVLRESELHGIARVVERRNLVLISDEIYEALTYDGARHLSPACVTPGMRERTIVVNSLSKAYAMTGWRVGYCAAPARLIRTMLLVLQQMSRGPATFVQDAAVAALDGRQDAVETMRLEYARRRAQVMAALDDVPNATVIPPEGGFFALIDVRRIGRPSDDIRRRLLQEFGVAVVHGAAYGACGEGTLRVSFGSGGDPLTRGLDRLRTGLRALS